MDVYRVDIKKKKENTWRASAHHLQFDVVVGNFPQDGGGCVQRTSSRQDLFFYLARAKHAFTIVRRRQEISSVRQPCVDGLDQAGHSFLPPTGSSVCCCRVHQLLRRHVRGFTSESILAAYLRFRTNTSSISWMTALPPSAPAGIRPAIKWILTCEPRSKQLIQIGDFDILHLHFYILFLLHTLTLQLFSFNFKWTQFVILFNYFVQMYSNCEKCSLKIYTIVF